MRNISQILLEIENFEPVEGNWLKLDGLVTEIWETGQPEKGIVSMLKVFERYPEDDGCEVFWAIVHGIESLDTYEDELIKSLYRQPSSFGIIMLHRIKNSGQLSISGKEIVEIYNDLLLHANISDSIKEEIKYFSTHKKDDNAAV